MKGLTAFHSNYISVFYLTDINADLTWPVVSASFAYSVSLRRESPSCLFHPFHDS